MNVSHTGGLSAGTPAPEKCSSSLGILGAPTQGPPPLACAPALPASEPSTEHSGSRQRPESSAESRGAGGRRTACLPVLLPWWRLTFHWRNLRGGAGASVWKAADSASALSLYLHSGLLPRTQPARDQGHLLGAGPALYSELPPALMTKALFWVRLHLLRSFPPRTVLTLSHHLPLPQITSTEQAPRSPGGASASEPQQWASLISRPRRLYCLQSTRNPGKLKPQKYG